MATTICRDSIVGDAWLQQTAAAVPVQRVIDAKTGQPSGDILTGPVRLAFETLFDLPQPTPQNNNPKFGAILMFTPYADFSIFYDEYYKACASEFADHHDAASGQYYGLHSPFRDQAEKLKFGGFTPGSIFITATSKFKPPVVDVHGNPITDRSKVYAGVWAICAVNRYTYKDPRKKGVAFGLQSVMIIGDDTKLGGAGADPNKTFAGVKGAISAPVITPGALNHMPTGGQPPAGPQGGYAPPAPPPGGTYAAPPGGTYAAPPAHQPPAGNFAPPPGAQAPYVPSGQPVLMRPPGAAQGYTMPGSPAPNANPPPAGFESWEEYNDLMN